MRQISVCTNNHIRKISEPIMKATNSGDSLKRNIPQPVNGTPENFNIHKQIEHIISEENKLQGKS